MRTCRWYQSSKKNRAAKKAKEQGLLLDRQSGAVTASPAFYVLPGVLACRLALISMGYGITGAMHAGATLALHCPCTAAQLEGDLSIPRLHLKAAKAQGSLAPTAIQDAVQIVRTAQQALSRVDRRYRDALGTAGAVSCCSTCMMA